MVKDNKHIIIIKLGGAAISNKKAICELAPENELSILLNKIAIAYQALKAAGHQVILVHGAGSFGHPQAVKYNLKKGWKAPTPNEEYLKGFSHIRSCLQLLNYNIIDRLESRNIPVLSLPPIHCIETEDCEETQTEEFVRMAEQVQKYLSLGFVPVLHGDAVLDRVRGCTILSGDIVMYQLAKLIPEICRCIFITDVYGVYQSDPKIQPVLSEIDNPLIHLIRVTAVENTNIQTQLNVTDNETVVADVTGGMQGKIKWAKRMALVEQDLDVIICRWDTEEALDMMTLKDWKDGEKRLMTVITRES
ncbi:MAG: Aspartate/glutamate/uridylate kinase [Benjaminiella poitrasii]|nr:MAG: Aspartate/glutamate/uridylate kinase [Benjaminiella poitrasii]